MNFKKVQFTLADAVQSIPGKLDTTNYFDKNGMVLEEGKIPNFGFSQLDYYLDYKINVQKSGKYNFDFEIATKDDKAGAWIDLLNPDGSKNKYLGEINFENTKDTDTYAHNTKAFDLEAGEYTIRIKFKSGDTNFRRCV